MMYLESVRLLSKHKIVLYFTAAVAAISILGCEMPGTNDAGASTLVGSIAPEWSMKNVTSKSDVKMSSYKGAPVLLVFWATWCQPCLEEIPHLHALHDKYGANLQIVSVASEDSTDVPTSVKTHNIDWTVVSDTTGEAAKSYKVTAIPHLFLISADGKVVNDWLGTTEEDELLKAIDPLIKKGAK